MDNRNLDDEELEQMRENERALRKITEEATRNISRILRSCHTRNNESANRQERVEDDDIQFIEQVQIPATRRNQKINEANNNMPVSHIEIEASNNAITQIATGETATAQAQLPPSQTFDHASSSIIQTQSIQSNNQKPSYSTTANQVKPPTALYLDGQENEENNFDDLIEQKSILPAQKLYRENTVLKRKITDMQQPVDASSSEAIKEAAFVHRPPPVCIIPRMPKVRLVFQDIRKKSTKKSIKKRMKIETSLDERTMGHDSSSPSSNTPTPQSSSNSLHHHISTRRNLRSTSGTMNACKDVMSNKLANQLFFHGSFRCDECEGKRELSQNAYPLHMLAKHGIFIGINGPILDHLRTLGEKSFRAIVWRCVHCKEDFGNIHEFDQHCKSEPHLSMMKAPSRQKKYTLDYVLSMCKEKNFVMEKLMGK